MPLVKKVKEDWNPVEGLDKFKYPNGFNIGDTLYISDPAWLIKTGAAILVDEVTGEEIPFNSDISCPVCVFKTDTVEQLQKHLFTHQAKPKIEVNIPEGNVNLAEGVKKEEEIITDETEELVKEEMKYHCKKCTFGTNDRLEIARHVRLTHPSDIYIPQPK